MPDVFSQSKRSEVMSRVRGKGNKATEAVLTKIFRTHSIIGWRRHYPVVGRPDFAFPKIKLAVFVDGCFWHGCAKHKNRPKGNFDFWKAKLDGNMARDRRVNRELRTKGWRVLRIWEHDLTLLKRHRLLRRIIRALQD